MSSCHFCGAEIPNPREVYRGSTCPKCKKDLKICLNCKFYSPGAHWDCSETIEEPVAEKDRSNFCPYFVFSRGDSGTGQSRSSEARKNLDRLFGNG